MKPMKHISIVLAIAFLAVPALGQPPSTYCEQLGLREFITLDLMQPSAAPIRLGFDQPLDPNAHAKLFGNCIVRPEAQSLLVRIERLERDLATARAEVDASRRVIRVLEKTIQTPAPPVVVPVPPPPMRLHCTTMKTSDVTTTTDCF
jgi:hypothetical protein